MRTLLRSFLAATICGTLAMAHPSRTNPCETPNNAAGFLQSVSLPLREKLKNAATAAVREEPATGLYFCSNTVQGTDFLSALGYPQLRNEMNRRFGLFFELAPAKKLIEMMKEQSPFTFVSPQVPKDSSHFHSLYRLDTQLQRQKAAKELNLPFDFGQALKAALQVSVTIKEKNVTAYLLAFSATGKYYDTYAEVCPKFPLPPLHLNMALRILVALYEQQNGDLAININRFESVLDCVTGRWRLDAYQMIDTFARTLVADESRPSSERFLRFVGDDLRHLAQVRILTLRLRLRGFIENPPPSEDRDWDAKAEEALLDNVTKIIHQKYVGADEILTVRQALALGGHFDRVREIIDFYLDDEVQKDFMTYENRHFIALKFSLMVGDFERGQRAVEGFLRKKQLSAREPLPDEFYEFLKVPSQRALRDEFVAILQKESLATREETLKENLKEWQTRALRRMEPAPLPFESPFPTESMKRLESLHDSLQKEIAALPPSPKKEHAALLIEKGQGEMDRNDLRTAQESFLEARSTKHLIELGNVSLAQGDWEKAQNCYLLAAILEQREKTAKP